MAKSPAKPQSSGKSSPGKSSSSKASAPKGKAALIPSGKAKAGGKSAKPALVKAVSSKANSAAKGKPAAAPVATKAAPSKRIAAPASVAKSHNSTPIPPLPASMLPLPTDGKPRKNQAGLHARELLHFREQLIAKRRELVGDVSSMEREALRTSSGTNLSTLPMHMADMGTDNYEQEFTLGLVEKDRGLLREINSALQKMLTGVYGLCEGTGKPIAKARLEAQPWARFSIEYARQMERGHRIG